MADISYTPTTWADGSGGGTPIDATKLNNIETGISDAVAAIGPNDTTADGTLKAQIDALGESVSLIEVSNASKVTLGQGSSGSGQLLRYAITNGTDRCTLSISLDGIELWVNGVLAKSLTW